jgi:hypothetical protein
LCEPGDDESLERGIERALANETPESIAMAHAHAQHWSMASLVDAYEDLYTVARERFHAGK